MPFYDFKCSNGHVFDELVKYEVDKLPCPTCGLEASRQVSAPMVRLDGTDPSFPGAYDSWERKRAKRIAEERKKSYATPPSERK